MKIDKKIKILDVCDYDNRSRTRIDFSDDEYGFSGTYTHKDLGQVDVMLTQTSKGNYVLMLDINYGNGRNYYRNIFISRKCSYRFAGLQAKKFLEDLEKKIFF
jgi:hypothetical protein